MSPAIDWQKDPKPIFDIVEESTGKYLVLTSSDYEFKRFKELLEAHSEEFVPVFTSSNGLATIYRIQRRPRDGLALHVSGASEKGDDQGDDQASACNHPRC
jgi:hypothetical protein